MVSKDICTSSVKLQHGLELLRQSKRWSLLQLKACWRGHLSQRNESWQSRVAVRDVRIQCYTHVGLASIYQDDHYGLHAASTTNCMCVFNNRGCTVNKIGECCWQTNDSMYCLQVDKKECILLQSSNLPHTWHKQKWWSWQTFVGHDVHSGQTLYCQWLSLHRFSDAMTIDLKLILL